MKINFFIDDECHTWNSQHEIYIVREDQLVYFELSDLEDNNDTPLLFIEDYELALSSYYEKDSGRVLRSVSYCLFRESFGLASIHILLGEQRFELCFEVLVKKVNAQKVEEMIHYLTQKQEDILRICLSRSSLSIGTKQQRVTDPETALNTVENFITTLISCRLELQHHLRKRLIPVKQPAWKSLQGSDIDPFDIIFNLDTLEPVLGEGDVVVNGRSFSISAIEVTSLKATADVEENAILLGGLYSMRRTITVLLNDIESEFSNSAELSAPEYESLGDVLLRLTSANMKKRCEQQLLQLEEFIRYFERKIGVTYQGECHPLMTPFVRASRVYRRLFEQLHDWYELGDPCLDGRNVLVKLRSISKIYEFVTLFKIIDYLHEKNWLAINTQWAAHLEFVPSMVSFQKDDLTLSLDYETKIYPYHLETKHLDLVDMKHSSKGEYNHWCPDFVLRLNRLDKTVYLILDAKYSSATGVKNYHLPSLWEKYFMNMAVYDAYYQQLKQDTILGVIALFPDKNALPVYLNNWAKHGINKTPLRLPILMGLPVLPELDAVAYHAFDQLFEIAEQQLKEH